MRTLGYRAAAAFVAVLFMSCGGRAARDDLHGCYFDSECEGNSFCSLGYCVSLPLFPAGGAPGATTGVQVPSVTPSEGGSGPAGVGQCARAGACSEPIGNGAARAAAPDSSPPAAPAARASSPTAAVAAAAARTLSPTAAANPDRLAISDDGTSLWAALHDRSSVLEIDISSDELLSVVEYVLPEGDYAPRPHGAGPMVLLPGTTGSLAVTLHIDNLSPSLVGAFMGSEILMPRNLLRSNGGVFAFIAYNPEQTETGFELESGVYLLRL